MKNWTEVYNELRDIWEAGSGRGKQFPGDEPHEITAKKLINELRRLHRDSDDGRFLLAIDALEDETNDLITEDLEWRRDDWASGKSYNEFLLTLGLAEWKLKGVSIRMAAAMVAAQAAVPAASFEAAVKRLQCAWAKHGKLALEIVRQKQGTNLSQQKP